MIDSSTFRSLALSLPDTVEQPHFERSAFRLPGKPIFASLDETTQSVNLRLSPADQAVFCGAGEPGIYPVPNKFGAQGWTTFELAGVSEHLLASALHEAYFTSRKGEPGS
jgi:hypothetical protein